ncbi:MAG TPA: protein-methionine-sulfoxide reductase heme-binding subunit MsrQ [Vicinamibacterales bacterium]|nr:protein-methionine-sulfoxide reductase heme-binding subunit MsrQ [Vicinamibacterales bacterium]
MQRAWHQLKRLVLAIVNWRYFKPAVFIGCAIPLVDLVVSFWLVYTGRNPNLLGAEPTKAMLHLTGEDALAILLLTLTVTPARRIFGANKLHDLRRMLGLWAFTYAAIHLSIYLVFDQLCYSPGTCQFEAVWQDFIKRPFIFVGQVAFISMLLLALTSTKGWQRRLRKNWNRLHMLVFVAAIAGVIHFIWIQKADIEEPLNWAVWLTALIGIRIFFWMRANRRRAVA